MATNVIKISQAKAKFATSQAALTTGVDFTCQVNSAAVVADPKLITVPATFCGPETQAAAGSGYHLELTFLQDWGATPAGSSLSQFLFDNDGKQIWFRIVPTDANLAAVPGLEGSGWAVAGDYGGDAGTPLQATVSIPLTAKPTISATITLDLDTTSDTTPESAPVVADVA